MSSPVAGATIFSGVLAGGGAGAPVLAGCFWAGVRWLAGDGDFVSTLAIAGVDGSLERRAAGWTCTGRVLAKTGSITGVSALSGYVVSKAAKPEIVFSILVNGATYAKKSSARGLQEEICELLTKYVDESATTNRTTTASK